MRDDERPAPVEGSETEETRPFRFGWRAALLDFTIWTILAALTAANRLLDRFGPPGGAPRRSTGQVLFWFADSYLWAIATPFIFWLAWRFGGERGRWIPRIALLGGAGVMISVAMGLTGELVLRNLLGLPRFGPPREGWVDLVLHPGLLFDFITYAGVLATGFAWEYFLRYRSRQEEAIRLQAHAAHLQAQLAEARLAVLRNQLNPHFLFNTLNAVSALVAKDPKGVRRMISRLSDLLRYSLMEAHQQEITVEEELHLMRRYLEILEIRYQGRLHTEIDAEPGVGEALVPSLLLQPLAENAMTHGVGKAGGYGRIEVSARREGDRLLLTVRDTGPGGGADDGSEAELSPGGAGSGVGLRNTRARLEELYDGAAGLELRPSPDGGMIAEIALPYHVREPARAGSALTPEPETHEREKIASGPDRR